MVHFVLLAQSAQNRDRVFHIGLAHEDNLEAAFQRSIFLDVLAVLVQRGCANRPQLAARQGRLKHVGSINRPLSRTCSYQCVQFVDEQNDLPVRLLNLLQHGLEPVFELAAVFRACQHRAQVERDHALVLQQLRNVAGNDALGQSFDDGGFSNAGFSDQHGIVLGPTRQHLYYAAHFLVAPNHRVELALFRQLGQVASVALQRLVLGLRILVRNFLVPAHGSQGAQNVVIRRAGLGQYLLRGVLLELGHRQQQVLGRYKLVLEVRRLFERFFQ